MKRKIIRKTLPVTLAVVILIILSLLIRLSAYTALTIILSYLLMLAAVTLNIIAGSPFSIVKKQLEERGYTEEVLQTDLQKGFSCKNIDVGTQFLVSYGVFTKIISFGDVLWVYIDSACKMHFILKDNRELLIPVEDFQTGKSIVKQMEKAYPWILFGYRDEIEQLRNDNFEDLKQLYTRKMFQCVVDGKLPENHPYPSNKPKSQPAEPEKKDTAPPYPQIPELPLENVKVPDNSLNDYFKELTELCRNYPDELNYTFHAPVREKDITAFEKRNKLKLPQQLKELFMFSDGFSFNYDNFYSLEEIEYHYNNWGPLTDETGEEYIIIADVVGDGEDIVFSVKTGIIYWEDHGEFTEYGDIGNVLEDRIESAKDFIGDE